MKPTRTYTLRAVFVGLTLIGVVGIAAHQATFGGSATLGLSHLLHLAVRFLAMQGAFFWVASRAVRRMRAVVERI